MGCLLSSPPKITKSKRKPISIFIKEKEKELVTISEHTLHHKKPISKKFKNELWDFYISSILLDKTEIGGVYCPTCHIYTHHIPVIIYRDQYSCGHVIPESRGGQLTLENCRPICVHCNSRMYQTPIQLPVSYKEPN